jgi:uroporphyrin-III C-methyltransferase
VRAAGSVWLVGAGPGDPELLTLKAFKAAGGRRRGGPRRLVSDEILDLAPVAARRISVAKRKSGTPMPQDEINSLLVAFALEGLTVIRLKGGDPSSSAAAARNWKPAARLASPATSCPASPPPWPRRPAPARP